uniref:PRELI/MSF1 domain-containing protein n=1 Tax=Hemiselmis andersenii TaxID=464988 RepID=A0A6U4U2S3_HEMAN|mmetsp:Transcript_32096/g.75042  ORF Transcript_32096/g.75042 Transcript_32096/m.75042 type:complete len:329 (+) Transcript_32096:99-1085(+)|eukprot:CAMPEP_0114121252 /NCGR_PEP_ID=MMETSP0043_2-20121206/7081_1 /TAXON_ID=464988 /ORGANISM="Hemiselmis andersenii, Strain CCMP644" /LENGTH=328 /DNA_ID=CAMNT_0001213925 /DNA_START=131 /DNA_END=1117 /DNA_ORIENTATION=+
MSIVFRFVLFAALCHASAGGSIEPPPGSENLPPPSAHMSRVLPYDFEEVTHAWFSGPTDDKFLREEVVETWSGGEKRVCKRMYTKNPFPRIVRMTVVRSEELVWYEEIKVHSKKRYATFWSINLSLLGVGQAYRRATMRADPNNPKHTVFEQEGGVVLKGEYPHAFKNSVEHFAAQAFLGICEKSTNALEKSLQVAAASRAASPSPQLQPPRRASPFSSLREGSTPPASVSESEEASSDLESSPQSGLRGLLSTFIYTITHPQVLLSALVVLRVKAHTQSVASNNPNQAAAKLPERQQLNHKGAEPTFKLRSVFGAAAAAFVGQSRPM